MDISWADYWWNRITGPQGTVQEVADLLSDGRSVSLGVPDDLPWRHEMRAAIRDALQSSYGLGDVSFEMIDGDQFPSTFDNLGEFLLDNFALKQDRMQYRPRPDKSIQSYLVERKVLKNRVVWLKGLTSGICAKWLSFCGRYPSSSISDGLFIIEVIGGRSGGGGTCVRSVAMDDHVSVFDARLLNSIVVSEEKPGLSDDRKRYCTALATHLCGKDVEVAGTLILQPDFLETDPVDLVGRIAQTDEFSRRGSRSDNHVLGLYRAGRLGEIKRRVWEAQVEVLYPLVEAERLSIISSLRIPITELIQNNRVKQFEEQIVDPNEIELGTLVYLIASRQLYVPDALVRERIHLLRDCRNAIAHRECCSLEQVSMLLDGR